MNGQPLSFYFFNINLYSYLYPIGGWASCPLTTKI